MIIQERVRNEFKFRPCTAFEQALVSVVRAFPFRRGRGRLGALVDRVLRRDRTGVTASIGPVSFPYLPTRGHAQLLFEWFEPELTAFLRKTLRPGDRTLDVGASVGYISAVALAASSPGGHVVSVEPASMHFEHLERARRLNPEKNWDIERGAVMDRVGEVTLLVSSHPGWHTTIPGFVGRPTDMEERVPATTVDAVFANYFQGEDVRVVKIDVEGAEGYVLDGARETIKRGQVDYWVVEVTPSYTDEHGATQATGDACYAAFESSGYRCCRLNPRGCAIPVPSNWRATEQENLVWVRPGSTPNCDR